MYKDTLWWWHKCMSFARPKFHLCILLLPKENNCAVIIPLHWYVAFAPSRKWKTRSFTTWKQFCSQKMIIWFDHFILEWRASISQGLISTSWWTDLLGPMSLVSLCYHLNQWIFFNLWYSTFVSNKENASLH